MNVFAQFSESQITSPRTIRLEVDVVVLNDSGILRRLHLRQLMLREGALLVA